MALNVARSIAGKGYASFSPEMDEKSPRPPGARDRDAAGDGARRDLAHVPAAGVARRWLDHRRRSADALDASRARRGVARPFHSDRRRRPARSSSSAAGSSRQPAARSRRGRAICGSRSTSRRSSSSSSTSSPRSRRRWPSSGLPAHRLDVEITEGIFVSNVRRDHRGAAEAAQPRCRHRARRFRHRLFVAELSGPAAGRQDQDRPELRQEACPATSRRVSSSAP